MAVIRHLAGIQISHAYRILQAIEGRLWVLGHLFMDFVVAVAAAAKSLQSWPTLCDPIDGSPPGSSVPGILQARTLEWVAISFSISQVPSPFLLPLPSPISQVPLIQKLSMPRWHILGWHTLLPFNYIHLNLKKKVE